MTTIQSSNRSAPGLDFEADTSLRSIPVSTMEEMCAVTILENQEQTQRAARESQRASQQLQREATDSRVAQMHHAADMGLVAGLVTAAGEAAASACSAAGGDWETVGKLTSTGARGVSAYFAAEGAHGTADAASYEALAARAGDASREAGDAATSAERTAERVLDKLGQIVEARRRAEEAATRA